MRNKIRYILMAALAAVFLFAAYRIYEAQAEYGKGRDAYHDAELKYVEAAGAEDPEPMDEWGLEPIETEHAPISVDFQALSEDCPDIQGWIYCEGTNINYPVVQGLDNDQYLRHTYLGEYAVSGSIFLEAANSPGFLDSNNIIYGHHMKDKSMFACLSSWADQDFYEEHPVMWLLTPEQDYRIELFSGYVTPAGSDVYAVFQGPSEWLDGYLEKALADSDFECGPGFELDGGARYVLLSTCDYTYQNARYVLHGKLVPVSRQDIQ